MIRVSAKLASAVLIMAAVQQGVCASGADRALNYIIENWRWSHYWFGKAAIDDVYADGKKIFALVFWARDEERPIRGLCSTEISLCLAYVGVHLDPLPRRMPIAPNSVLREAFEAFVKSGFADSSHMLEVPGLSVTNFSVEEMPIILPAWEPPSSIIRREIPEEASRQAERVKRLLGCDSADSKTPSPGCKGTLIFAYYGKEDPYWFVLRTCSDSCDHAGDSVEELTRGDFSRWEVTSSGFINSPKSEVLRLKQQIEKAEMFRFELPP